ncbi:MAG: glycosyltransferase family 4 protein [Solirubrobacteraceae bacterium]
MRHAVIVSPNVSNAAGGVERMCVLLARVLEQQGWSATIVGPEHEVTRLQFRLGLGPLSTSRSGSRAARAQHPNLIVTNGYLGVGYNRRIPRIHVYHGTAVGAVRAVGADVPQRERIRHVIGYGSTEALSARGARAVVCVADSAATEVRRFYRVNDATVIPNGIDTVTFSPIPRAQARAQLGLSPEGRCALFVGRLDHGKGARLILDASRRAGFELVVAGPNASPDAINLGLLEPSKLTVAYSAADCVLFPSKYEACSYVVLEALACGVPLITTRVGWMPTLLRAVPAYEALCVEPALDELVARLRALEEIDTSQLTSRARAFVREHNSLERYGERWHALLESHIEGG